MARTQQGHNNDRTRREQENKKYKTMTQQGNDTGIMRICKIQHNNIRTTETQFKNKTKTGKQKINDTTKNRHSHTNDK